MSRKSLIPLIALYVLVSCNGNKNSEQYIDSDSPYYKLVSESRFSGSNSIYLVGPQENTTILRNTFASCDFRDNASGIYLKDYLPDFSGEEIISIVDRANGDYDSIVQLFPDSLKNITVSNAITALDTLYGVSPYDKTGIGEKKPAKMIILSSACQAEAGYNEIKDLFSQCGNDIPVFSPLECAIDELFSVTSESFKVAFLTSKDGYSSKAIVDVFHKRCKEKFTAPCECVTIQNNQNDSPLSYLLDQYVAKGYYAPLDAIIVTDLSLDAVSLQKELERITSVMNESSLKYNSLISKDFRIIGLSECITRTVFDYLRENNGFRHKIAYPVTIDYMTQNDNNLIIPLN